MEGWEKKEVQKSQLLASKELPRQIQDFYSKAEKKLVLKFLK